MYEFQIIHIPKLVLRFATVHIHSNKADSKGFAFKTKERNDRIGQKKKLGKLLFQGRKKTDGEFRASVKSVKERV